MPYVDHKGTHIFYRDHGGDGLPLILIQGLGLSSDFWLGGEEKLQKHFRIITLDNRGVGRSDKSAELFSVRLMAQDVLAVIEDLQLERYAVAGISLGGMIAQEVAIASDPKRLAGLVLMVTTPGLFPGKMPPISSIARLLRASNRNPRNLRRVREVLVSPESLDANPEIFAEYDRLMQQDPILPSMFLRQLRAASFHRSSGRLEKVTAPTLIIGAEKDRLVPCENSEILAKMLPQAKLRILPGVGHVFRLESPDALTEIFEEFHQMLEKKGALH